MLTVKNVAERLGVSSALVYSLVAEGKIPTYRIGLGRGAIRFTEADLSAYLASCRLEVQEGKPAPSRPTLKHLRLS